MKRPSSERLPAARRTRRPGAQPTSDEAAAAAGRRRQRPVGELVGARIAELRQERRMTLDALAAGTGLTPSYLSKLERGHTSISVDNLRRVAHFLGVEMVHFFEQEDVSKTAVTRRGRATRLRIAATDVYGESLIATSRSKLQATLYRTPPGQGRRRGFSHPGEEFVFVIRGRIEYQVAAASFTLSAGDGLWHRSEQPHMWMNRGKTAAITLHVNTPPVW
jgi:transcriptional regulator with XRE-family HTH domain